MGQHKNPNDPNKRPNSKAKTPDIKYTRVGKVDSQNTKTKNRMRIRRVRQ